MAYKSGNPALNKNTFKNVEPFAGEEKMTLDGVASKSMAMLALCVAAGIFGWNFAKNNPDSILLVFLATALPAFIIAIIIILKKSLAPVLAPSYAVLEGVFLGAISQIYNSAFAGIVLQAILLTGGIFLGMLLLYRFRVIKATENFKMGVAAATLGICFYYVAFIIFSIFGVELPLVASNSLFGIGFTVFVIIIAALNLVVDFDFIESGVEKKAPKHMEWYASFGLFVTLVWLYLEILRLLAKIRSR